MENLSTNKIPFMSNCTNFMNEIRNIKIIHARMEQVVQKLSQIEEACKIKTKTSKNLFWNT